jgi:hypothetical protein
LLCGVQRSAREAVATRTLNKSSSECQENPSLPTVRVYYMKRIDGNWVLVTGYWEEALSV